MRSSRQRPWSSPASRRRGVEEDGHRLGCGGGGAPESRCGGGGAPPGAWRRRPTGTDEQRELGVGVVDQVASMRYGLGRREI
jgi:hypothetical protein